MYFYDVITNFVFQKQKKFSMNKHYILAKAFVLFVASTISNLFSAQTYCYPTYSSGCTSWRISQVTIPLANFDNTFAAGTCITGRDRTSVTINLSTNVSYTINISTTNWISCGMAIDFNKDGDFDDTGEALFLPSYIANQNQTYSGNFTIPTSVTAGNYRMRVWNRVANSGDGTPVPNSACATYGYGTWTDYTVNLSQLSTSEVTKSTAKVYPIPASNVLNIENKETVKSVEIYDYNGKLLKTISENSTKISINLSELVSGNYTAKVNTATGNQVIKFIKK